jgi:hypothetical protein
MEQNTEKNNPKIPTLRQHPDNLFRPGSLHSCSIAGRAKTAQGGIGKNRSALAG